MKVLSKTRFAHESNALSNAVAEYLLDNYSMVEHYNARVIAARDQLKVLLAELGIPASGEQGNFLLLDLGDAVRTSAYVAHLRAQKIYVKGPWSVPWDRYATITLGPIEVMTRFIDATRKFCAQGGAA
jgi:histidinol-phosphate/aromatic aminotransferase/cobyric acid decarboxylase-like protein